ncbi:peptidoglycan recognition protein family protein [Aestuariivita boseongensis]|uniref:peptidoglycan recognition protein family protein n=1 Tax=Aestuariivita boseongensis TaxID=1470562 RepID=UPI001C11C16E|nr:peptidoglycan-binding domain-containing protein [Aestuariivita boseongensis]
MDRVFLHCSASDNPSHDNVATIKRWHTDPKPQGRGWSDTGYHYFIRKNGILENGRPLSRTPAAQAGHNTGTIAICLHGLDEDKFTESQFATLKNLCVEINDSYDGTLTFHGHREVASKACPVFDYKAVLKLDQFGRLGLDGTVAQPLFEVDDKTPDSLPTIRRGDRGPAVALLQRLLMIKDDGIFGPKTDAEVRSFQTSKGLVRDGICGPMTWAAVLNNDRIVHASDE